MLPKFFYNIESDVSLNCCNGWPRWSNQFAAKGSDEDRIILTAKELTLKLERDMAYDRWVRAFRSYKVRPKLMRWQVIQILNESHSTKSRKDWWPKYKDAVFRVFVNPHVEYSADDNKSWYVLSPEDTFLVHAYERESRGLPVARRFTWKWIPHEKQLRQMLLVPVQCCRHLRHETTAGSLPAGL